jgi:hypothetical protein
LKKVLPYIVVRTFSSNEVWQVPDEQREKDGAKGTALLQTNMGWHRLRPFDPIMNRVSRPYVKCLDAFDEVRWDSSL